MSNVIKIKHGSNPPAAGVLEENELGYSSSNNGLYLGQGENEPIHLNDLSDVENKIEEINESIKNVSGIIVSDTEPENINVLWIDTSNSEEPGLAKYYDSISNQWIIISASATATWG